MNCQLTRHPVADDPCSQTSARAIVVRPRQDSATANTLYSTLLLATNYHTRWVRAGRRPLGHRFQPCSVLLGVVRGSHLGLELIQ